MWNYNPKRLLIIVVIRESISNFVAFCRNERTLLPIDKGILEKLNKKVRNTESVNNFRKKSLSSQRYVLLDQFPVPQWLAINTLIAHMIGLETNAIPTVFSFRRPARKNRQIFSTFEIQKYLVIKLHIFAWIKLRSEYLKILRYLDEGHKLIDYKIDEIPIGIDIYESILRLGRKTVSLKDIQTYRVIFLSLKQYCFFLPLFQSNRIGAVIPSHDNYVGPGLMAHMAFRYEIPVILANTLSLAFPTKPFQLYEKFARFDIYRNEIPKADLTKGKKWAEMELRKRIEGQIGVGMDYQIKSAFTQERISRQTKESEKLKILILTHDFFDNPHAYSRMIFDDFYSWLDFLGKISIETDYEWYIKAHRDYSDLEVEILSNFVINYPNFVLIDPETSYHQLREEGIKYAFTCYGSAGHELPLIGFTVINASYNPHVSYDFNVHSTSIEHYREIILNLSKYAVTKKDFESIYEYYFIHKKFVDQDNLMGISQIELSEISSGNYLSAEVFEFFEQNISTVDLNVAKVLKETVSQKLVYSFERSISENKQLRNNNINSIWFKI